MVRGEILLQFEVLRDWQQEAVRMNEGKRGRPFRYPKTLILFFGLIRAAFHLPYRQLEGLARSLNQLTHVPAPDYTTFSLRLAHLWLNPEPELDPTQPILLVVDSSGIKRTHRGEWRKGDQRQWVKIHVAVDARTKQVLSLSMTDRYTHDSNEFMGLVKEARNYATIDRVLADAAYDDKENYHFLKWLGIKPGINPKSNSGFFWRKRPPNTARADVIREWRKDPQKWKERVGYKKRQAVESFFSSFKRQFGESAQSRTWMKIYQEMMLKVWLYNLWVCPEAVPTRV